MMDKQPLISVLMPAYNAERYIAESIESVIAQRYEHWELIIVNDGSTDATLQVIAPYLHAEPRIRLHSFETNLGLIAARSRAVQEAQGDYIAMLDSDDLAMPERLSEQLAYLEAHPSTLLVGSACQSIDASGKLTGTIDRNIPDAHIPVLLLFSNYLIHSTVMFRAAVLKELGYATGIDLAEDYFLFSRASKLGGIANIKKPLVKYRLHGHNISQSQSEGMAEAVQEIQRRQLTELDLEPNKAEQSLHAALVDGTALALGFDLEQVETWLLRIVEANKKNKPYDQQTLAHYAAFFFRRACESSGLGLKAVGRFRKSPLAAFLSTDLKANFAFILKSLTK